MYLLHKNNTLSALQLFSGCHRYKKQTEIQLFQSVYEMITIFCLLYSLVLVWQCLSHFRCSSELLDQNLF